MLVREVDGMMAEANARTERSILRDEVVSLRQQVAALERDLARARRCLAAERRGREQLRLRLLDAQSTYDFAVSILCRLAFGAKEGAR